MAVEHDLGELTAILSARSRRQVDAITETILIMRTLKTAQPNARISLQMPSDFLALSPNRWAIPLGWYLTDHSRRRLDLRLSGAEASRLEPNATVADPQVLTRQMLSPEVATALTALGEDLGLLPDVALVEAPLGGSENSCPRKHPPTDAMCPLSEVDRLLAPDDLWLDSAILPMSHSSASVQLRC